MKLAILGATGVVGRTALAILEERGVAIDEIVPLASPRSAGTRIAWRGREWRVEAPSPGSFRGCDVAVFSAGADRGREWAPRAADAGAVVVDNSSAWRMDPDVPLVVPEVNAGRITDRPKGIIANPNCSTIQIVVAAEALRRAGGIERIQTTTLQSVSGAGRRGLEALAIERDGGAYAGTPFPYRIADDVVPSIGARTEGGWTGEEEKIRRESRRILELPDLSVAATCVRVPVRVGHAAAVAVDTVRPLSLEDARAALEGMPGVEFIAGDADPSPRSVAGSDGVRVGRLRRDPDRPRTFHLWVVADNLRKGAATNAIQIVEAVIGA